MQTLTWYFIIFGKTILMVLSPHSSNSDIHFVQDLLVLGCQEKIKAGSTRGRDFREQEQPAPGPTAMSILHSWAGGQQCAPPHSGVSRSPLSWARSKPGSRNRRGVWRGGGGNEGHRNRTHMLCCGEFRAAARVPPQHGAYQLLDAC